MHRYIDRQTDKKTHRYIDKQTDRQKDKKTHLYIDRQTDRQTKKQKDVQIHIQTNRQTRKQTDRQTERPGRQKGLSMDRELIIALQMCAQKLTADNLKMSGRVFKFKLVCFLLL